MLTGIITDDILMNNFFSRKMGVLFSGRLATLGSAAMITLPRAVFSYPFYCLASVLLVDFRTTPMRAYFLMALLLTCFFCAFAFNMSVYKVSPTAFIIEIAMLVPLLIFLSGFNLSSNRADILRAIRLINLVVIVYSLVSLVHKGFPVLLPYRDFVPDYYWGPFSWGGARIVTIFGFTGLVLELSENRGDRWKIAWVVICITNFIVPSYNIGIVCGLGGLVLILAKRPRAIIAIGLLAVPTYFYIRFRLVNIDTTVIEVTGWHPKILAHILVYDLFSQTPSTLLSGTGLGQFTSTPQIWSSGAFHAVSGREVPAVPGLHSSQFHLRHIEPVANLALENRRALTSAFNKPFTGFTTLASETGILFFVLSYLFLKRAFRTIFRQFMALSFLGFFIALNLIDQWIDNLWLGYCLLLVTAYFESTEDVIAAPVEYQRPLQKLKDHVG